MGLHNSKTLIFGNLKGNASSLDQILRVVEDEDISNIVSLGRFDTCNCYFPALPAAEIIGIYRRLTDWAEASAPRHWIGVLMGYDYVTAVPFAYPHISDDGKNCRTTFRDHNLRFAHYDETLHTRFKKAISEWEQEPHGSLLFFYSHSYYMGVDNRYLGYDSATRMHLGNVPGHALSVPIEDGKQYWISTGPNQFNPEWGQQNFANFAIFDPKEKVFVLRSVFYDKEK